MMLPSKDDILRIVTFKTSRSGGKGGQNVNKVSSKVELILNINDAFFLNKEEKELVYIKLANRIDSEGLLHIISQEDRSQLINKQQTVSKLMELLLIATKVDKERKATKIPKAVIKKRLENKRFIAKKKESRRVFFD
jgi:ribosome-associated protein